MARRGPVCVVDGCTRRAEARSVVCADHFWTALDAEAEQAAGQVTRRVEAMARVEDAEKRRVAASSFREQIDRGAYASLQPAEMLAMLEDSGGQVDLTREIGMLRIAMLRVLREEEHPSRMAHALAKLSFALGRSLKQEVELKGKRELSENERWMIVMDHILPPFPALDASADEVATRERRELVMNEIWQVINAYEEEKG